MSQLKVLVTGATGFVGNYVVKELLKRKISVIASSLDKKKAESFSWFQKVTYLPLDISKMDESINYFDFFRKPDLIIHLAWAGLPDYKSEFHTSTNLPLHKKFLTNIIHHGLTNINVVGTCLEYGLQEGALKEDQLALPVTAYGKAKNELHMYLKEWSLSKSFTLKWIRLFYMYGKGQNPKSLLAQLETAINNNQKTFNMSAGDQVRDYLHIQKVAENITKVALQNKVTGTINCCSGIPITVKKLVEDYLQAANYKMELNLGFYPYPDYEPMKFWGDPEKINSVKDD